VDHDEDPLDAPGPEAGSRTAKLTLILDAIGWRSASDAPASVVAIELDHILAAAASGGWDAAHLRATIAESLRQNAHPLDGSSSPAAAWHPTAAEIIRKVGEP
jgi:hypothetical protein